LRAARLLAQGACGRRHERELRPVRCLPGEGRNTAPARAETMRARTA
jgi:hypothetical protein